jgi:glycosyltransferase involved in cell wall biosynthesis
MTRSPLWFFTVKDKEQTPMKRPATVHHLANLNPKLALARKHRLRPASWPSLGRTSGGIGTMKILLAAASFHSHISGLQRHARNVARCLLQQPEVSDLHVVVAPWQRDLMKTAGLELESRLTTHIAEPMIKSSFSRNLWYYRRLPELAADLEADLVHLTFPMPVNAAAFSCPTVATLHDLYPYEIPANFGFPKSIFNRLSLKQCLRSVDAITCVSETTRLRLKQYASPAV